ncbi:hypothetical protein [Exiguobacterium antarcticum]|uniref:hypothetical protein n=1 Tax=Exiguobacterium antarcticum TaxID=132920 RepID=UPI000285EF71|nr:hypothetical protein [Exiguobacterium antarcticum]AFS70571.1 Hypothetical protein Eab7_1455 [Exiguobacterium antarcticum B7]
MELKRSSTYWEAIKYTKEAYEPVSKKQSALLLQTCENTKNVVAMPKHYRTLDTYGLYFNLQQIGTHTRPIELQYIATDKDYFVTCRSPKTFRLTAHPIQLQDHPWLKQTDGLEHSLISEPALTPRLSDKATKRKHEVVDVSGNIQRVSIEFPVTGQVVVLEKEDGKQKTLFGLPASFAYPTLELSVEKTTDGLPSSTYALLLKGDLYQNQQDLVKSFGKQSAKLTYHPLPDVLAADKTIPYLTLQSEDPEQPMKKTISLRYETTVKDIPVRGFNGVGTDNKEIHGFLHPNEAALREGNFRQLSLLSDKLAKRIADELKDVTLEKPQGKRADVRYLSLIQDGKIQTFDMYLKTRANKTDLYLKDIRTQKAAKLSGELATAVTAELED